MGRRGRGSYYQFLINTEEEKGGGGGGSCCFLCLELLNNNNNSNNSSIIISNGRRRRSNLSNLKMLARYLKCDFGKVLSSPPTSTSTSSTSTSSSSFSKLSFRLAVENAELDVPLCASCSSMVREFNELYGELELVRMELEAIVRKVGGVMKESSTARERKDNQTTTTVVKHNKYPPRRVVVTQKSTSPSSELVAVATASSAAVVTDKLREEVFEKCLIAVKNLLPKVQLDRGNETTGKVDELALASIGITVRHEEEMEEDVEEDAEEDVEEEEEFETPNYPQLHHGHSSRTRTDDCKVTRAPRGTGRRRWCNLCSKMLGSLDSFREHMRWHTGAKPYRCDHCPDESFTGRSGLRRHRVMRHPATFFDHHPEDAQANPIMISKLLQSLTIRRASEPWYQCPFCPKQLGMGKHDPGRHVLYGHLFGCHMGQLASRLRALKRGETTTVVKTEPAEIGHDDDDDNDKPVEPSRILIKSVVSDKDIKFTKLQNNGFRCSLCSKVLYTPAHVKAHKFMHTGQRPFKCDHCQRAFRFSVCLKDHEVVEHKSILLAAHKDSRLTSDQFEQLVVEKLFRDELRLPELAPAPGSKNKRDYKCCFCESFRGKLTIRVHRHIIQVHEDLLTPRLRELQEDVTRGGAILPPPPSSSVSVIKHGKRKSSKNSVTPSAQTMSIPAAEKKPRHSPELGDIGGLKVEEQAQAEEQLRNQKDRSEPEAGSPPGLVGGGNNDDGGTDLLADISSILGI